MIDFLFHYRERVILTERATGSLTGVSLLRVLCEFIALGRYLYVYSID